MSKVTLAIRYGTPPGGRPDDLGTGGGPRPPSVLTQFEILGSAFDRRKLRGIDAADGGGGPYKPNGAPAMQPH